MKILTTAIFVLLFPLYVFTQSTENINTTPTPKNNKDRARILEKSLRFDSAAGNNATITYDEEGIKITHSNAALDQYFRFASDGTFYTKYIEVDSFSLEFINLEYIEGDAIVARERIRTPQLTVLDRFLEAPDPTDFEIDLFHQRWEPWQSSGMSLRHVDFAPDVDESWQFYTASTGNLWLYEDREFMGYFNENSGAYLRTSDRKLKRNVKRLTSQADKLALLQPSKYQFKKQKNNQNHYGFIAQELQAVFPEMVTTVQENNEGNGEPLLVVDYEALIPVLVAGWQEQQEKIVAQEQAIDDITEYNQQLEERLKKLESALAQLSNTSLENRSSQIKTPLVIQDAYIKQNKPNPFNNTSDIEYYIPTKSKSAFLTITNFQGQIIKQHQLSTGKGSLELKNKDFSNGTYTYSLIIDNQLIDTKKIIFQQ